MRQERLISVIILAVCVIISYSTVNAQSYRTFVSGFGNDANPCTIPLPCRTFQRAVAAVSGGGEVVPLDSAGYGTVTIAKSVSITAPDGVYAGISTAENIPGVAVDGVGIDVYLKGLTIIGPGVDDTQPDRSGIAYKRGLSLFIDRCRISGFNEGVIVGHFDHAEGLRLLLKDTIIHDNQTGVYFGYGSKSTIIGCTIEKNGLRGIFLTFDLHHVNVGSLAAIHQTSVNNNESSGIEILGTGSSATISRSIISRNAVGLVVSANGLAQVADTVISGNQYGWFLVNPPGGSISFRAPGTNTVFGNGTPIGGNPYPFPVK